MSDLISRAEAIEAIESRHTEQWMESDIDYNSGLESALCEIKALPSATCDDCIWHVCNYNKIDWDGEDGYISRQDAIDEIKALYEWHDTVTEDRAVDHLKRLPSAEPKTGKWVDCGMNADGTHNIKCDQCGAGFRTRGHANSHYTKERFKWCPTCGARMRGEEE